MIKSRELWSGLGDFWLDFENRDTVELFWDGMNESLKDLFKHKYYIDLSRSLFYLPEIWESGGFSITLYDGGPKDNRINGEDKFKIDDKFFGAYSIPTLTGINTGQVLTEGTHYNIINYNTIEFLALDADVTFDPSIVEYNTVKLYCDKVYRVNPLLLKLYRRITGVDNFPIRENYYHPYTHDAGYYQDNKTYWDEKIKHLRYMCWALFYLKLQRPTITNILWIFNVLYNYPFAYRAGTVTDITVSGSYNKVTILQDDGKSEVYTLTNKFVLSVEEGDVVKAFQPLSADLELWDYYSNQGEIEFNFTSGHKYSIILAGLNTGFLGQPKYINSVVNDYVNNYILDSYQFTTHGEITGVYLYFTATEGNTSIIFTINSSSSVRINWGDAGTDETLVPSGGIVTAAHSYDTLGTFRITLIDQD